jgi:hypothetical protein
MPLSASQVSFYPNLIASGRYPDCWTLSLDLHDSSCLRHSLSSSTLLILVSLSLHSLILYQPSRQVSFWLHILMGKWKKSLLLITQAPCTSLINICNATSTATATFTFCDISTRVNLPPLVNPTVDSSLTVILPWKGNLSKGWVCSVCVSL